MNGSIISLIQEKRKLFYTGKIRNIYKKNNPQKENNPYLESIPEQEEKPITMRSRGFQILQEIFSE